MELARLTVPIEGDISGLNAAIRDAQGRLRDARGRFISQGRRMAVGGGRGGFWGAAFDPTQALGAVGRSLGFVASRMARWSGRAGMNVASGLLSPIRQTARTAGAIWENGLNIGLAGGAGALGFAVKQAGDLESTFVQIDKAANLDAAGFDQLKAGIKGLATDAGIAGVSLDELTAIAMQGAKLGIADKEGVGGLLDYTRALAMINISIDDLPIDEVARSLGQISNVFGLGTDKALGFASAVDALADSSTADAGAIFDVAQRASGAARAIGLGIDELLGLSTALLDVGFNEEAAGSTLSRIMGMIASGPEDFAATLGLDPKKFAAMAPMEQMKSVLQGLAAAPAGSAGFRMLEEMGVEGVRAQTALLQLSQTMGNLDRLTATANAELGTGAHILESVAKGSGTAWSALTLLWNRVRLLGAELGEAFLPAVKAFSSGLGSIASDAKSWVAENQALFESWGQWLAEKFTLLGSAIKQWPDFFELGTLYVQEFAGDTMSMFKTLGEDLIAIAKWIGESFATALVNALRAQSTKGVADFLSSGWMHDLIAKVDPELARGFEILANDPNAPELQGAPMPAFPTLANPFAQFGQVGDAGRAQRMRELEGSLRPAAPLGEGVPAAKDATDALLGMATEGQDAMRRWDAAMAGVEDPLGLKKGGGGAAGGGFSGFGSLYEMAAQGVGGAASRLGAQLGITQGAAAMAAPGGTLTGQTFDIPDYAKRLQEGVFKKEGDQAQAERKLARKAAEKQVKLQEKMEGHLSKIAGGVPAVAVGPA